MTTTQTSSHEAAGTASVVTVHIRNQVRDFVSWKAAFDSYQGFRENGGVRCHRVLQRVEDPSHVDVELDFDTTEAAAAFAEKLQGIWATPRSKQELVGHEEPVLLTLVESRPAGS